MKSKLQAVYTRPGINRYTSTAFTINFGANKAMSVTFIHGETREEVADKLTDILARLQTKINEENNANN